MSTPNDNQNPTFVNFISVPAQRVYDNPENYPQVYLDLDGSYHLITLLDNNGGSVYVVATEDGIRTTIAAETLLYVPLGDEPDDDVLVHESTDNRKSSTPTDHQLAILFRGLEQIHPDVAAALRASFAQQVATLDADSADYNALVADLINVLRGQFVAEMHADHRYTGMPLSVTEAK